MRVDTHIRSKNHIVRKIADYQLNAKHVRHLSENCQLGYHALGFGKNFEFEDDSDHWINLCDISCCKQ